MQNGSAFSSHINLSGVGNSAPPYSGNFALMAGDTVDFAVGCGNGSFFNDSTGLAATVCYAGP